MSLSCHNKSSIHPPHVADSSKIVLGAGARLPAIPGYVADQGKIRLGAGARLPAEREAT